jgi:hypothetical protein
LALLRLDAVMRALLFAALLLLLSAAPALGCGGVYYSVSMNAASLRLEQARAMGAESQAPFEYYYAREHLRQAQVEATEASYSDAASYAETAELYAQKAIDTMQAAKRDGRAGATK